MCHQYSKIANQCIGFHWWRSTTIYLLMLLGICYSSTKASSSLYDATKIAKEALTIWRRGRAKEVIQTKKNQLFRSVAGNASNSSLVKEYLFLVILSVMHKNYKSANLLIQEGLEVAKKGSWKAVKDFYEIQAMIYYQLGEYEKAHQAFKRALQEMNTEAGWEEPEAAISIICYMMRCAYYLKNFDQVIFYGEALASQAITSFVEKRAEVAEGYEMLARAYYKQGNYLEALYYSKATIAIKRALGITHSSELLRSYDLALQVHEAVHDFNGAIALLDEISVLLRTRRDFEDDSYTSYLEEKYALPITPKPLSKVTVTLDLEKAKSKREALATQSAKASKGLYFPTNSIPPIFQLKHPSRGIILPSFLILLSYAIWGGWIYSMVFCWKATNQEYLRVGGMILLFLTIMLMPLSLYLLYSARSMIALSGLRVGLMQDVLVLDESIESHSSWLGNFLKKSILWFISLDAIVVIPYERIEKIVWHSGGTIRTRYNFSTTRTQVGSRNELGEEYTEKNTEKIVEGRAEKYIITEKKRTIRRLEETTPQQRQQNNAPAARPTVYQEKYKLTETVHVVETSFAGVNKLAVHALWKGRLRVYLIDEDSGIYAQYTTAFFQILVKKGVPFDIEIEDRSDLLRRRKEYLQNFASQKKG